MNTNEHEIPNESGLTEDQERSVKELIRSAINEPQSEVGEDVPRRADVEAPKPVKRPFYKRGVFAAVLGVVLVASSVYGARAYSYAAARESTDDAFVDGHPVPVAAQVAGRVARVAVTDNQEVKKGDLLLEIDPSDYRVALSNAQASLQAAIARRKSAAIAVGVTRTTSWASVDQAASGVDQATSSVQNADAAVTAAEGRLAQAEAQVAAAQAEATRASAQAARYSELLKGGVISQQDDDNATAAAQTAIAQLDAAKKAAAAANAAVGQARAQVSSTHAQVGQARGQLAAANAAPQQVELSASQVETADAAIQQAQAAVEQAKLALSYTKIFASEDGRITKKSVEAGAYIQPAQTLMTLVPDTLWVTANFKETQLEHMRPGQPVEITVDAYPDLVLKGHVDSLQSGSGAAFSLLPPENATGNYVKVVQRVPVKIVFDEHPDENHLIGPGMSVVPEVVVR